MTEIADIIRELDNDNRERDAYHSINGYFYQFELTLLHILIEGTDDDAFGEKHLNATYELETIEDYAKYIEVSGQRFIRVAQIKHYTTEATNSKYYDAVLWLYYNFLKFIGRNPVKTDYLAFIFHYDRSPEKEDDIVLKILDEAIVSNKKKENDDKRSTPYKKIVLTTNHSQTNKELFAKSAKFKKCDSFDDVTHKLKIKLKERYSGAGKPFELEWLYAAAVSKLIHDGKQKKKITLAKLDEYIGQDRPEFLIQDFYKEMIIDKVFYLIDNLKASLSRRQFKPVSEDVVNVYEHIYETIKLFLKEKFQEELFRTSFLNSVATKKFARNYKPNSLEEYQVFLECIDLIAQFVSKLAKVMYFYEKSSHQVSDLNAWFILNGEAWLFKFPYEERGNGVIMGDSPGDPFTTLEEILSRFGKMKEKPDVMYLSRIEGVNASHSIRYVHDIMDIVDENFIFCDPSEEHFHIQCLQCLSLYNYENIDKIEQIFKDGCLERGDAE